MARRTRSTHPLLSPALSTDLPVLVALVGSWLFVPVAWAHVGTGLGLVALVTVHLRTRHTSIRQLLRRPWSWRRLGIATAAGLPVAAASATAITGAARWLDLPPERIWHGGTGYLLIAAVAVHLCVVRRRLWRRLHREGARS
jgi:hypothetical protein